MLWNLDIAFATDITPEHPEPNVIRVISVLKDINHNPIKEDGLYTTIGNPFEVPINDYVANVLPNEIARGEPLQARRAQAVAIRNYIWHRAKHRATDFNHPCFNEALYPSTHNRCDTTDSTLDQAYVAGSALQEDYDRVAETKDYILVFNKQGTPSNIVAFAEFSKAHRGDYTVTSTLKVGYLQSIYDPVANFDTYEHLSTKRPGNRPGMAQDGAISYAQGYHDALGYAVPHWNMHEILAHYYRKTELLIRKAGSSNVYQDTVWGDYRMNIVEHAITSQTDGTNNDLPFFYTGKNLNLRFSVQNSGIFQWGSGTQLSLRWAKYKQGSWSFSATEKLFAFTPEPGDSLIGVDTTFWIPDDFYDGRESQYYLWWDLKLSDGSYASANGWHPQAIRADIRRRPTPPRSTPPPNCPRRPCPMNAATAVISWNPQNHPDPLSYAWRNTANNTGGNTTATSVQVPLAPGTNYIDLLAYMTADPDVGSTWSSGNDSAALFYDPIPPVVTLTPASHWTAAASVQLTWSATDPDIITPRGTEAGSGVTRYIFERQINAGPWEQLLDAATSFAYTQKSLVEGYRYTFRLTVFDAAGNTTTQERVIHVDRTAPTTTFVAPSTGTSTTKTWIVLRWNGDDHGGVGVDSYAIEYRIRGKAWQVWQPVVYGTAAIFQGDPVQVYEIRVRARDRLGNQEAVHPAADTSFALGTDSSGLSHSFLPVIPNRPASARPEPVWEAYPLPK